jgi:hypothetical protein
MRICSNAAMIVSSSFRVQRGGAKAERFAARRARSLQRSGEKVSIECHGAPAQCKPAKRPKANAPRQPIGSRADQHLSRFG